MKPVRRPLLLTKGKVITLDGESSICEALAIEGNRIVAVGRLDDVRSVAGPDCDEIDVQGRAVIPGLIDTHAHMDREGLKSIGPSLAGCRTIDDVLQRIEIAARQAEPGEWIVTMPVGEPPFYWDGPAGLREQRLPNRRELDRVSPRNPVYIRPIWGYWRHAPKPECIVSAANSLALAATGLTAATPFPSGTVEPEIDPETGVTEIVQFVAADDFGTIINPLIVEGQVHGGITQGVGQALLEGCVYDPTSGQLVTASYMDYTMPRAADVPSFKVSTTSTPSPSNPLGIKGCGEAGAIGSPPAVINAITDAIGNNDLTMPATPQRVWAALRKAQ